MNRVLFFLLIWVVDFYAQTITIKGEVFDEYLEPFPGAIIKTSDKLKSTVSDINGYFELELKTPNKIIVTSIGYSDEIIEVNQDSSKDINVILKENPSLSQIIVSASRLPERVFESPVSVERFSFNHIKKTPSIFFYEDLDNFKNINVKNNNVLLKSINTRGFNGLENFRFVQLIDGIDNVHPSSGFTYGNLTGVVDSDVENVEVLTGASSALYGANAFNGLMLINTKSPFDYQGVSVKLQAGVTSQESGVNSFYFPSLRMSHRSSDYFAVKASFSIYQGEEWHANDVRPLSVSGRQILKDSYKQTEYSEFYNGVNIYGDEQMFNPKVFQFSKFMNKLKDIFPDNLDKLDENYELIKSISSLPNVNFNKNGFNESQLVDNNIKNSKINASLHYRPLGNQKLELTWSSRFNETSSLFSFLTNRVSMKNSKFNQHSFQINSDYFYVRGAYTDTDSGNSYDVDLLGKLLNREDQGLNGNDWVQEYVDVLLDSGSLFNARQAANQKYSFKRASNEFKNVLNRIKTTSILEGGAMYQDKSSMYNFDANLNLKEFFKPIEIQLGGAYKRYVIDSDGVLTNLGEQIYVDEYGAYTQFRKRIMDDRLVLMTSVRLDKSKNFDTKFSYRGSIGCMLGTRKNHHLRFSAQSAFRQPTIQEQYSKYQTGTNSFIVGNTNDNLNQFKSRAINPLNGDSINIDGKYIRKNAFDVNNFDNFQRTLFSNIKAGDNFEDIYKIIPNYYSLIGEEVKIDQQLTPELVNSFELGYRSMLNVNRFNVLEFDFNVFYNKYENFISYKDIYVPLEIQSDPSAERIPLNEEPLLDLFTNPFAIAVGSVWSNSYARFSVPINSTNKIHSYGLGVSLQTKLASDYRLGINYSWNDFKNIEQGSFVTDPKFNSPKHNVKLMLGNEKLFKYFGFNMVGKWQSAYRWNSYIANGDIDARFTVNCQFTYELPKLKSRFKLGGTNLLGKEYYDNLGTGKVGSTYYLAWIINE